jgi:hypothetical protein
MKELELSAFVVKILVKISRNTCFPTNPNIVVYLQDHFLRRFIALVALYSSAIVLLFQSVVLITRIEPPISVLKASLQFLSEIETSKSLCASYFLAETKLGTVSAV